MTKSVNRTSVSGAYVVKLPRTAPAMRPIDLVTTQRLKALDEKLDLAYKQATETLREIRAAVRK